MKLSVIELQPNRAADLTKRILLACVGGYCLSATMTTWGAWLLSHALPRSEAVVLMAMLGFVIYLLVLLWAFAEPRLLRLWLMLAVLPVASHILAIGLGPGAGAGG